MRPRLYWIIASLLITAALLAALWWAAARLPAAPEQMMAALPAGDGVTVYVDTRSLRKAGLLDRLAGGSGAEEQDYQRFVETAGFNYRTDLDSVLLRVEDDRKLVVASGRFRFGRLRQYFLVHGGRCVGALCSMQGSAPERQISWVKLGRGSLGLAVSADPLGAASFGGPPVKREWQAPQAAVWIYLPGRLLRPGSDLPVVASALLPALDGARHAIVSFAFIRDGAAINLDAECSSPMQAAAIEARLKHAAQAVRKSIETNRDRTQAPEWMALLAAGQFHAGGNTVRGRWLIGRARFEKLGL